MYKLNTGVLIPAIGFGTWQLHDGPEVVAAVKEAIAKGYRLIDTAKLYGNEDGVGQAIQESSVPRDKLFITTKLWNTDQGYETAFQAFDESLQRLQLEYLDLYLIHWPVTNLWPDAWLALSDLQAGGRVKSVGVSNFNVSELKGLQSFSKMLPAVNQIEFHPYVYSHQAPILDYCQQNGIAVEAYSPLCKGLGLNDDLIVNIAKLHNKTSAQVMLRWAVQHDTIPIPKSVSPKHIEENVAIFDFELSVDEMRAMDSLSSNL